MAFLVTRTCLLGGGGPSLLPEESGECRRAGRQTYFSDFRLPARSFRVHYPPCLVGQTRASVIILLGRSLVFGTGLIWLLLLPSLVISSFQKGFSLMFWPPLLPQSADSISVGFSFFISMASCATFAHDASKSKVLGGARLK